MSEFKEALEWKTIDSAPKDGTEIIIYCGQSGERYISKWSVNGYWNIHGSYIPKPIAWIPLQSSPEVQS